MDAVTEFPPRSPFARTDLLPCHNFSFAYPTETLVRVRHTGISSIANDHLSSLDRTCSDPALRKNIPGQNQ